MVIAVNTRFMVKDKLDGVGYFIRETFRELVSRFPQHEFYFLFDRPFSEEFIFSSNVHPLVVSPPARMTILWKYWYDIKVPLILKRIKADVFVSPDGYCSLTTKVPQCMVVHDLGFLHFPEAYKKMHVRFLKTHMPKFLKKAKAIAAVSGFTKKDIIQSYHTEPGKINIVYNGVKDIFKPLDSERKEEARTLFTEGKEFFIYVGAMQPRKNLLNLLKAFSVFKKRQQSNMKLVLAGGITWKNEAFLASLKTYKYREDVVMTGYLDEEKLAFLLGSSYALVYPSLFEGFGVPVLEAMRSHVPALTSANSSMQEIAGDAALYFDPDNHEDIADKMMLIYKDEELRKKLIEKGTAIAAGYTWQRSAELLWKSVEQATAANSY